MNTLRILVRDAAFLVLVVGSTAIVRLAVRVGRVIDWVKGVESDF